MATQNITITFDPTAEPQFTFSTGDPYLIIDEETTIEVTLNGATFSSPSVIWSIPPAGPRPSITPVNNSTISFLVPAPTHYFQPWVFRISVDTPGAPTGITGIRSPNIFLTNSQPGEFNLEYVPANGNFNLMDPNSEPTQDGLISADELVLVNAIVPYDSFVVELQTKDSNTAAAFASEPVLFSNSAVAGTITATLMPDTQNLRVLFEISPGAAGQSTGLRFQIAYNGVTFLSPDPILINSTIGDG
jgi:hypothetical protein